MTQQTKRIGRKFIMRKNQKIIALSVAAIMAALALTACSNPSSSTEPGGDTQSNAGGGTGERVEIEYLSHKSEAEAIDAMDALIAKFCEENPDIKVIHTPATDFNTVITTRAQTNEMPDVFSCTTNNTYEIMFRDGLIMDLAGQEFFSNVEPETLELSKYDGKNWRLPYSLSAYGIYIRTDILAENGLEIPETYEELMNVSEELMSKGITPFVCADKDLGVVGQRMERLMGIIDDNCDTEFRKIADGSIAPADSVILNTFASTQKAITKYSTDDSLGVDQTASYQNYVNDGGAMMINGTWTLVTLKDYSPDIKVAMIPFPNPTGGDTKVPISIDTSFCISNSTKHKEACLKFLEFLSRTENAQIYTDFEGSPNVIKGVDYNVAEFAAITEKMNNGEIFVSLNAVWPSGLRNEMRDFAQALIMDGDEAAFIEAAGSIIIDTYNK